MILADPFMIFVIWRLCINIYAWQAIDVNIILHLVRLKMESDKKYIRYCFFFFVFIKRKMLLITQNYLWDVWWKCQSILLL